MNNQNFLLELITRLRKSNPSFFKKLQIAAMILGAASVAMGWVVSQPLNLPLWVVDLSKYLASMCGSAIFVSFLPNQDVNQQQ